jgi:uncharacterized protein (DUF342 family)
MATTFLTLFASSLAVLAAIIACVVTVRGLAALRLTRFDTLQARLSAAEDSIKQLDSAVMNLRARLTMQATREKRKQAASNDSLPASESDSADPKADVRRELTKLATPFGVKHAEKR